MSEQNIANKKLRLKINVSKKSDALKNPASTQIITEWNYMRIALALLFIITLLVFGVTFFQGEEKSAVAENKPQETPIKILADKNTNANISADKEYNNILIQSSKNQTSINKPTLTSNALIHAQLAKGIWKDKPFGNITESIKVNNEEATGIYYFTELKNMKGKTIFHIWKFEDKIIFKKKKDIPENHWKTHTSKLFTKRSIGFWSVETVDSKDQQLNIINFDVIAE